MITITSKETMQIKRAAELAATPSNSAETLAIRRRPRRQQTAVTLLVIAAVLIPLLITPYQIFQWTMIASYAIALLGLNILMGYNGQISLGHGAFYAIGAYASGILIDHYSMPYLWTIPAAAAIGFVAGFLFGLPALKLENLYLALATFGLAVAVPQLLKYGAFDDWTGGFQGITIAKPDVPLGLPITQDQWLYYLSLAVALLMFVLARNLLHGRMGRAIIAVRDHPVAASAMGVNLVMVKSLTFGVSAMYMAVAGALATVSVQYVSPDSFTMFLSITLLVGAVIGGLGTLSGPLFGATLIGFLPNFAEQVSKSAAGAVYGVLLIAFVFIMPTGIAGGLGKLISRLFKAKKDNNISNQETI
ncbi:branched-chain amino acid ABC transporter permease [Undibacterium sp.]|uniref:branched-chain amino acid ABC transporter permease n=1 Tax=Undibacterium sp. TaxID=1914977 RepID=UPI00374CC35E